MIRAALELTVGACVILALAWVFLFVTPLAHAGETCGLASHYGAESGSTTANLEHFNPEGFTAASRGLPFNAVVAVTMLDPRPTMRRWYGKTVTVRINDRGPFHRGKNGSFDRFIDLATGAARTIGLTQSGVSKVCIRRLH